MAESNPAPSFNVFPEEENVYPELLDGYRELFMGEESDDEDFFGFTDRDFEEDDVTLAELVTFEYSDEEYTVADELPLRRRRRDSDISDDDFTLADERPLRPHRPDVLANTQEEAPGLGDDGVDDDEDGWTWSHGGANHRNDLPFTGTQGIQEELPDEPRPLDFFNLFVKDEDFDEITQETNRYADEYVTSQPNLPRFSRARLWPDGGISTGFMKCFLGLTILMGLLVHEDLSDYWTTNECLQTPFFGQVMNRNLFLNILSFLHLSNNAHYITRHLVGYNPLQKLGNFYRNVIHRFGTVYSPGQHLSIDEGMIGYRGRVHFRVYAPDKPQKYGMKANEICDATTQWALYVQCTYIVLTVRTMYVHCTYSARWATVTVQILSVHRKEPSGQMYVQCTYIVRTSPYIRIWYG